MMLVSGFEGGVWGCWFWGLRVRVEDVDFGVKCWGLGIAVLGFKDEVYDGDVGCLKATCMKVV